MPVMDPGPGEDLCDDLEFHPPWTRDFLDPVIGDGGDALVFHQSLKPAGGEWSFSDKGLHLISISIHLLDLCVAQGRVLLIVIVFIVCIVLSSCCCGCSSADAPWAARLSGTTSSITKDTSVGAHKMSISCTNISSKCMK
jgi:hypothetical protein